MVVDETKLIYDNNIINRSIIDTILTIKIPSEFSLESIIISYSEEDDSYIFHIKGKTSLYDRTYKFTKCKSDLNLSKLRESLRSKMRRISKKTSDDIDFLEKLSFSYNEYLQNLNDVLDHNKKIKDGLLAHWMCEPLPVPSIKSYITKKEIDRFINIKNDISFDYLVDKYPILRKEFSNAYK